MGILTALVQIEDSPWLANGSRGPRHAPLQSTQPFDKRDRRKTTSFKQNAVSKRALVAPDGTHKATTRTASMKLRKSCRVSSACSSFVFIV